LLDYLSFKKIAGELAGINLENYKSQQMDRRIHSLMNAWKIEDYDQFLTVLKTDPRKYLEFEKKLTINVSEFFRNPERFAELQTTIIPLLAAERRNFTIWSAGCSNGAEPYSVAIILRELGLESRARLLASDVDRMILAQAERAVYSPNEVKNLPPEMLAKYFSPEGEHYRLAVEIKRMVEFGHQDLLRDPFETDLDLIICRNVVIYFTETAKGLLYGKFLAALRPGGFLLVGGTEPLLNYRQMGYESYMPSFYRKPALEERSEAR
jgi:chemotaxis protein methyltransferase CheR